MRYVLAIDLFIYSFIYSFIHRMRIIQRLNFGTMIEYYGTIITYTWDMCWQLIYSFIYLMRIIQILNFRAVRLSLLHGGDVGPWVYSKLGLIKGWLFPRSSKNPGIIAILFCYQTSVALIMIMCSNKDWDK